MAGSGRSIPALRNGPALETVARTRRLRGA